MRALNILEDIPKLCIASILSPLRKEKENLTSFLPSVFKERLSQNV